MRALGVILQFELRSIVRSPGRVACIVLVTGLMAATVGLGYWNWTSFESGRVAAEAEARQDWLNQGNHDPHSAAHHGTYIYKSVPLLGALDPGLTPYLGTTLRVEAHAQHRLANRPVETEIGIPQPAVGSAAAFIQIVLPLVAVVLGFASVSRDCEIGVLDLMLGHGARWRTILLGKAATLFVVILTISFPALVGLGFAAWSIAEANPAETSDVVLRLVLLAVTYGAYLTGWACLTVLVSAVCRSSRSAFIGLIAIWTLVVFVVPPVAAEIGTIFEPLPTAEHFERQHDDHMRYGNDGKNMYRRLYQDLEAELLKQYGVETKEDLPVNFEGASMLAAERYTDELYDELYADLHAKEAARDRLIERAGSLSPFFAVRALSMSLSGTDRFHHEGFSQNGEQYRRRLVLTLNEALAAQTGPRRRDQDRRSLWESVPPFEDRPLRWTDAAPGVVVPASMLLVWCVGTAVGLFLVPARPSN